MPVDYSWSRRRGARAPLETRLRGRSVVDDNGCWIWQKRLDRDGYGIIEMTVAPGVRRHRRVHRVSYEHFVGDLMPGMVLDHLCRVRACINPAHLEQVTARENAVRGLASPEKTQCVNGHALTEENSYRRGNSRECRTCIRDRAAAYRARKAAK